MSDTNDMRSEFEAWMNSSKAVNGYDSDLFQAWQVATEHATASQWQDIATAPMHQIVLVSVVGAGVTFGSRIGSCGWNWEELDDEPADAIVSHWMPLPLPPAIRQGNAK